MSCFGAWRKYIYIVNNQNNCIIEAKKIFDGVFDRMIEEEAWQNISSSYPFSAELLEKYKDRLDWHKVSGNGRICRICPDSMKRKPSLRIRNI